MRIFILEVPRYLLPDLEDVLLWQHVAKRSIPDLTLFDDHSCVMGWRTEGDRDLAMELVLSMLKASAGEIEFGQPLQRRH